MAFSWKLYVELAEGLVSAPICKAQAGEQRDDEIQANYRAALSRAYYGLFRTSHNYLRDVESDFGLMMPILQQQGQKFTPEEVALVERKTRSLHQYVINQLKVDALDSRKNKLRSGLRMALAELLERRREADYSDSEKFDMRTVKTAVDKAKQGLTYVAQLTQ